MGGIEFLFLDALHLLGAHNHLTHDFCHERLGLVSSHLNFFMADLYRHIEATQIRHDTDAKDADAAVMGHNHLWNGGHTDGVATYRTIHAVFGRGLECRTLHTDIDTVFDAYLFLLGYLRSEFDQFPVVSLMHIGETGTCGEVLASQRVLREEVDMVGDDHQVAHMEIFVHAACGIRYEEGLDAQFVHHADREGHLFHRVAFVIVEAPFHGEDIDTSEFSEDEFAAMAFYGGNREVGNLGIGVFRFVSYF